MKLIENQIFSIGRVIDLGELAGDKAINFYLIKMKIGTDITAYHLDCDGKNPAFENYPDVCKPRLKRVDWDKTIFPTEATARIRAREILAAEYPGLNSSAI